MLGHLGFSRHGRSVQGGAPQVVLRFHVRASGQQEAHDARLPVPARKMEGAVPEVIRRIHELLHPRWPDLFRGRLFENLGGFRQIVVAAGLQKRRRIPLAPLICRDLGRCDCRRRRRRERTWGLLLRGQVVLFERSLFHFLGRRRSF